jgi:hypothetical protein
MKKALIVALMMIAGIASAQDFTQKNYICQETTDSPYIFNFSKDFLKFSRKFLGFNNIETYQYVSKLSIGNYIFSNPTRSEVLIKFAEETNDIFYITEKNFAHTGGQTYRTMCRAL